MTRRVWSACLVMGAALTATSTYLSAETQWTRVRGEGFVLHGQLSAATLTAIACDLETAVRAFGRSTATGDVPQVVAVDGARSIREWLPQFNERGRGNPLGAYWRGLYGDHIVVRVDASPAERLRRVLHEYAHFATHVTRPEPSPWLDEGLSEVWEHAVISPGDIEIGRPVKEHLKRLRSGKDWIPVRELVAANTIPTRTNSATMTFYAESWALVHYLVFQEQRGRLVLDRFPDPSEMPTDAALRGYVQGPMGPVVAIPTAAGDSSCQGHPWVRQQLYILDTLLYRAKALADGERPGAALPLLQAALMLDHDNAETLETIGFVHFRENRPAEAAAVLDRVIAAGKGSFISYYYRAVLAEPVPAKTGVGGPIPQVEYLRKALALNPGFTPAVQRLRELIGGKRYLALRPRL